MKSVFALVLSLVSCCALVAQAPGPKSGSPNPSPIVSASDTTAKHILQAQHQVDNARLERMTSQMQQLQARVAYLQAQLNDVNFAAEEKSAQEKLSQAIADGYKTSGLDPQRYDWNLEASAGKDALTFTPKPDPVKK